MSGQVIKLRPNCQLTTYMTSTLGHDHGLRRFKQRRIYVPLACGASHTHGWRRLEKLQAFQPAKWPPRQLSHTHAHAPHQVQGMPFWMFNMINVHGDVTPMEPQMVPLNFASSNRSCLGKSFTNFGIFRAGRGCHNAGAQLQICCTIDQTISGHRTDNFIGGAQTQEPFNNMYI